MAQQLWRVTKPGGVVVWVVADATIDGSETGTSFRQALRFMEIGFRLHDTMIYEKVNTGGARGSNAAYWQAFEFMFVFTSGAPKTTNLIEDRQNAKGKKVYTGGGGRNADGTITATARIASAEYVAEQMSGGFLRRILVDYTLLHFQKNCPATTS